MGELTVKSDGDDDERVGIVMFNKGVDDDESPPRSVF